MKCNLPRATDRSAWNLENVGEEEKRAIALLFKPAHFLHGPAQSMGGYRDQAEWMSE